ncbi:MAG: hypothetical protein K2N55_03705 [Lachnospiraceae bacterium]|nr:hypothetical protein [Lachnospiraceae bacterium]
MKKKIVIFLCTVCLAGLTACGGKEEEPVLAVEAITEPEEKPESDDGVNNKVEGEQSSSSDEATKTESTQKNEEELEGNVESISSEGVILSRAFTYETDDGSGLVMVSGADESGDQVLVTVSFSENTKYELWTVKNSGVNGDSDITKQEASFADIKEGVSLKLTGHFTAEEKEYAADYVIIYNFV